MAAQDWIMAGAQLGFAPSMLYSIRSDDKPALRTSLLNVVLVAVIATCQATLSLWAAAATSTLVGATWAVLTAQKAAINRSASQASPTNIPTDHETSLTP